MPIIIYNVVVVGLGVPVAGAEHQLIMDDLLILGLVILDEPILMSRELWAVPHKNALITVRLTQW